MITVAHRFRYSDTSDLTIGRDDQGRLFYQQWGPHPETGVPAEQPLGWQPYAIHHGQEEAEELLRLKAELDLLKSADERHYGAVARPAPPPAPVDREALAKVIRASWRQWFGTDQVAARAWDCAYELDRESWRCVADAVLRLVGQSASEDAPTARPEQEQAERVTACEELEAMLVPHAEPGESAPDTLRRLLGELEKNHTLLTLGADALGQQADILGQLAPERREGEGAVECVGRLLSELGERRDGGVDVGAVREVVKTLRNQLCETPEEAEHFASLAHRLDAALGGAGEGAPRPTVVCLCGSSRFRSAHDAAMMAETLAGRIVIGMGCFGHDDYPPGARAATSDGDESTAVKQALDALHLRKIDLADEVLVIDVGGYVGASTAREIAYAESRGKRVRRLSEERPELTAPEHWHPAPPGRSVKPPRVGPGDHNGPSSDDLIGSAGLHDLIRRLAREEIAVNNAAQREEPISEQERGQDDQRRRDRKLCALFSAFGQGMVWAMVAGKYDDWPQRAIQTAASLSPENLLAAIEQAEKGQEG